MIRLLALITVIISTNLFAEFYTPSGRLILEGPEKIGKSDSGIYGPTYQQMKEEIYLFAANNEQMAELVSIGSSELGVDTQGLLLSNRSQTPSKLVVVTGATHGNEYLNIVDRLAGEFLDTKNREFAEFFQRGGAFLVLPVANPDGYSARERRNDNNVDLNRDFSNVIRNINRFTQNETANLAGWVDDFIQETSAQFMVSMDYHCCYRGALLFPWAFTDERIPQEDRDRYNILGGLMVDNFDDNPRYGATSEIIWYNADGTSKDYWYAKYGALAMTYEGRHRTEKNYLANHVEWWKGIVSRL